METLTIDKSLIQLDTFKGESFCRAACWFDLIATVGNSARTVLWNGSKLDLQPGQIVTTMRQLADRWSMTSDRVRTRLKELAKAGLIKFSQLTGGVVVTVLELCPNVSEISDDEVEVADNAPEEQPAAAEPVEEAEPTEEVVNVETLGKAFDEIFDSEISRRTVVAKHGIRNWNSFRNNFIDYVLANKTRAAEWRAAANLTARGKYIRRHAFEIVAPRSRQGCR
jgi:hypothetical protein